MTDYHAANLALNSCDISLTESWYCYLRFLAFIS
nr:MAG TPA: hypothetical protein [Bacteriophage sp.]